MFYSVGQKIFAQMGARLPVWGAAILWLLLTAGGPINLFAQQPTASAISAGTNALTGSAEQQIAALQLEMTNAWKRVLEIVNRPVPAYQRTKAMKVQMYAPSWFHPGATIPDFVNVDVRKSQDVSFGQHKYVSSDVTPGKVFLGADCEFNVALKYFYINRDLPKHRLSEAEMNEINQLYRIIGRCANEMDKLQTPAYVEKQPTNDVPEGEIIPGQSFETIRKVPMEKRLVYAGVAIGSLLLLLFLVKLFQRFR